jgi:hypothetical protein
LLNIDGSNYTVCVGLATYGLKTKRIARSIIEWAMVLAIFYAVIRIAGFIFWMLTENVNEPEPWNPVQGYSREGEWCEYGVSPIEITEDGRTIGGNCYAKCAPNCATDVDPGDYYIDEQWGRW